MQAYYDELWERLPADLEPPAFERRRDFLVEHVRPGWRVLDVGCGEGAFAAELARAGAQPVGVEVAARAVERARAKHPGVDFRHAPIGAPLPLEDQECDAVWASEVLEHVADTAALLSELRRVLRPGGTLLITTPSNGRVRLLLDGPPPPLDEHLRLYTRASLRDVLGEFGFAAVRVRRRGATLYASAARSSRSRS